ncbi:MAG: NAD(P)H-dependent oxidoreductase [Alphaproteobacteria bacterium]|nr:MAG: NAD(P)H-dependent oxidoreductase [Alphaproteobacteria bacterium]
MASNITHDKPRIGVIIGTTRKARFADKPAQWFMQLARQREDMDFELLDLRDFDLPFFDELASNLWVPSEDPKARRWQETLAGFDGFVVVTAEYNHSMPAVLKNALDQAYREWMRKPMGFVGYGGTGAARAIEHLRGIAVELQMVPLRNAVHIGGSEFLKVHPMGENGPMESIAHAIEPAARAMLDELAWWARATKAARASETGESSQAA